MSSREDYQPGLISNAAGADVSPESVGRRQSAAAAANAQTQSYAYIIVMVGLVPAISVFASHRSTCRGSVDARSKSGHDEFTGVLDHLNEFEH
jgi:hypothetical protein